MCIYSIVSASKKHIGGMVRLENECFSIPWTEGMFVKDFNNEHTCYFVALNGDEVIGYCGMWVLTDEGQITNIAVSSEYRNLGIATDLIEKLFEICIKRHLLSITLEVREGNIPAVNLYKKLGFKEVGLRKNYYKNPSENALLMTKEF